ncbi:hypothetical protein PG984_011715 [Apiospora sp. TS-2023a]
MSSVGSGPCIVCEKPDSRRCGRCNSALYCSKACQVQDWPVHKLLCATFAAFDISTRPTSNHFRSILFPPDEPKPKLIWLHCEWHDPDPDDPPLQCSFQFPDGESLVGPDTMPKYRQVQYNPILKRHLDDTIKIAWRDTFLVDGSKPNKSILSTAATQLGRCYDWRGRITAYGAVGTGMDQTHCRDLDMNDFRHITDFFLSYGNEPLLTSPKHSSPVKGVMINCLGDQTMFNKPQFEAIDVSQSDPIFSDGERSDIAQRIGLPILTRRCPRNPDWSRGEKEGLFKGSSPANNQAATFLHQCCDPADDSDLTSGSLGWGWVHMSWQHGAGSVLVVRQDKKPLWPLHAEALSKYCQFEIRPLLAHTLGEYAPDEPLSREAVLAMICRPTFSIHWYKLLEGKTGEDNDAPFPL